MTRHRRCECVVIGGGPAGATAATVLADHGHDVLVLERAAFPRHHVGESLVPHTYWAFKRLGMLDKLNASDFPRKESVQFISADGSESQPFYFTDRDPGAHSTTWQVTRPRFDQMLLDNAREHGAEIVHGALVREVLFEGDRAVGVRAEIDGKSTEVSADVVIDATGQSHLLTRQLNMRRADPRLHNGSMYAYFESAVRDTGRNAGATIIIRTPKCNGWFWYIPLAGGVTSVGVVGPPAYLCTGRGDDPAATLDEEIAACLGIQRRLGDARRVSTVYVTSDFTYRAAQPAGHGWVLVGDAFGFIDPVYSSGVLLALTSGQWAADAVHNGLSAGDVSPERLGSFVGRLMGGISAVRELVYAFYNPRFHFGRFLAQYPQYKDGIVRILIGDVFDHDFGEMFEVMQGWCFSGSQPVGSNTVTT